VPSITEAMHLDASGRETLRVSRLARNVVGSGTDYSQDPRFLAAQAGVIYFSPVYFRRESEPYMTIALPLKGPDAGIAVAEVNLKLFWGVISQVRVGEAGYAYVVDSGGILIAHPDIGLALQKTALGALPQVRAALAVSARPAGRGNAGAAIGADLGGREVLTAHAAISPVGWHVFVEQPLREAFSPLYAAILRTGILLLAGLALSTVVSLFLARRMLRPIQALEQGAARIGAGSLDERITLRTGTSWKPWRSSSTGRPPSCKSRMQAWSARSRSARQTSLRRSARCRRRPSSSKLPAVTNPSSLPTCPTNFARRCTPSSAAPKSFWTPPCPFKRRSARSFSGTFLPAAGISLG
jgi:HAMP domain-containing protein